MNVELDPGDQKDIEELAHSEGKDPGEFLRGLVHEALLQRKANGESESAELREQEAAWQAFLAEVDNLPVVEHDDGVCASRDHDRIIYPDKC
jgi:hypothetical protein